MKKNNILLKTNILVCFIVLVGFIITAVLSYRSNYSAGIENIEKISSLSSDSIYHRMTTTFTRPVNVSLTMANDSLLKDYLDEERGRLNDESYVDTLKKYLNAYKEKYNYDSVFLVSTATNRYYNFNGIDRILTKDNPENKWYYAMLNSDAEYALEVDNDEAASNEITVFVNCKIKGNTGNLLGIVGVGVRIDSLQGLLKEYEEEFSVKAYLVNENGDIEISTDHTGYQKENLFEAYGLKDIKEEVLSWKDDSKSKGFWTEGMPEYDGDNYVVTRYIPELFWHLVIERDTGILLNQVHLQLKQTAAIIAAILFIILYVITYVIKGFNKRILKLTQERKEAFRMATEQLYDNIYEINITQNCAAGVSTQRYFESLGIPKNMSYSDAIKLIAKKQIKEEFREGYLNTFLPENALKQYEMGNTNLQYDFLITQEESQYYWMRIDARIYYNNEDDCLHMFMYRKNIDEEKRHALKMDKLAHRDTPTQLYNKTSTKRLIEKELDKNSEALHAFFILDIDNFKQANDKFGHSFGDFVISDFAATMRAQFRSDDILGRIGGDEFVAFIPIPNIEWAEVKAKKLSLSLNKICVNTSTEGSENQIGCDSWKVSASIGVSISPKDGVDFETLYKNADNALYETKKHGKNGFTIYGGENKPTD